MASPTYQELFLISAGAQDCARFNKEVETTSAFAGRDNSSPGTDVPAGICREKMDSSEISAARAGILCSPPASKLPSQLQELPGSFQASASGQGRLLMPDLGGLQPQAVPKGTLGCAQKTQRQKSLGKSQWKLLLPSLGQSINLFLPISEPAPGEESHYLNINSLCGLSCNKAGVRRC